MFKGLLVAALLSVTGINQVFSAECVPGADLWGGDDPHVFYYCDPTTNAAAEVPCAAGKGFISNDESQGCVAWSEWSSDCISNVEISATTCNGVGAMQPHAYGDPSNYYLCIAEGSTPVQLSCQSGYGFYSGNKYLGCFPWSTWRQITGCVNTDVA